ncbi:MAG: hypothetical protein ACK41O_18390, partial [Runella zeae]
EWQVEALDMKTLQSKKLIATPTGSEDCAWSSDGTLWMAQGAKLYKWNPKYNTEWQEVADWSSLGIKQITRLAINPQNNKLAFVWQ